MKIYHMSVVKDILGPGERLVFWLSGCKYNCKGCIAPLLQNPESGTAYTPEEVITKINETKLNVTFSGGEPLYQSTELLQVVKAINCEIILYTGKKYDNFDCVEREVAKYCDLIIDGSFQENKVGDFLWRGSSNQNYISPKQTYNTKLLYEQKGLGVSIAIQDNSLIFYGVPRKDEMKNLYDVLLAKGIKITDNWKE